MLVDYRLFVETYDFKTSYAKIMFTRKSLDGVLTVFLVKKTFPNFMFLVLFEISRSTCFLAA